MAVAALVQAGIKIISIPLLLAYYGKQNFGILALALSVNLYLQFLSFGVPGSLVKFISASWYEKTKLRKICQSANSFFLLIAIANFVVLYIVSEHYVFLFGLTSSDAQTLRHLLITGAISSLFYWPGAYMDSLMTAREDLVALSSFRTFKSFVELVGVILLSQGFFSWNLNEFFIFQTICIHMFLPVKIWRLSIIQYPSQIYFPKFNWGIFKPVLSFSFAVLVIHIMNSSANYLRPVLMAIQCSGNTNIVADYRVLETIVSLSLLGAGFLRTSLLPPISRAYSDKKFSDANELVKKASQYGWTALALPLFIGISAAPELLTIYVGKDYIFLSTPLRIWLLSTSVQLYNGPGFAAVMGGGNIRYFALSSIVSGSVSLLFLWVTAAHFGIYSVAISAVVLNGIHMIFLHSLILNSVPKLQTKKLLLYSYLPPLLSGTMAFFIAELVLKFFHLGVWIILLAKIAIIFICYFVISFILFKKSIFNFHFKKGFSLYQN